MTRILSGLTVLFFALALVSCADQGEDNNPSQMTGAADMIMCEDPRPEICTREYDPVCATMEDGSVKTYATGCTACADSRVTGYTKGPC